VRQGRESGAIVFAHAQDRTGSAYPTGPGMPGTTGSAVDEILRTRTTVGR
jgi:hypothetical protein